jgi:pimeloyl-ACP methyl ester carboxylesterase/DNA-binding CsgD family transcriptional regulator
MIWPISGDRSMAQFRFCTSIDSTRIAYSIDGVGPPLVRAALFLNHLELDWECPVWKPYLDEFSRAHMLVRHDLRGFGLSDLDPPEVSLDAWVSDLEAVVDAAGLDRFGLFGMCHGGPIAIEYCVRHPERVSHLVLMGSYAQGLIKRAATDAAKQATELRLKLAELGWGQQNEAFQQVWPTLMQPRSTLERLRALSELQRRSAPAENALRLLRVAANVDVCHSAPRVTCPTLVLHSRDDLATPFEQGRLLAALIPNARLVALNSPNHVLVEDEPAWHQFVSDFRAFLPGCADSRQRAAAAELPSLTKRESEVLERIAQGLDNTQIAAHLDMSEKTVRNHITRIFDKLAVENRPQAIVRAREAGLGVNRAAAHIAGSDVPRRLSSLSSR